MKFVPRGSRRERAFIEICGFLIYLLLRILYLTTRREIVGGDDLFARFSERKPVILSFWHGRLAMMPFAYAGRGACIMNSRHRDGALVSRTVERLGIEVVHGSSTRGWVGGLRGLLDAFHRGKDLVVVPDGPRGPRCQAKSGVIQLARSTGVPIYPVAFSATRSTFLRKSWDRMLIPKPFAKLYYVIAAPVLVVPEASPPLVEDLRVELESRLTEASRRADELAGMDPDRSSELLGERVETPLDGPMEASA